MKVFHSSLDSPVGIWRMNADDVHVLSVELHKTKTFPQDDANELSSEAVKQLSEYFNNERQSFDLPLDMSSYSPFYQAVWQQVASVPFGKTKSYSDIAIALENPGAVRAVGLANGKNPFPIIIPCHRIIGKNNSLTGYAYGTDVKEWLLVHEGSLSLQTRLF